MGWMTPEYSRDEAEQWVGHAISAWEREEKYEHVIVDTEDALLIVPREQAQDVRDVVKALGERDDPRR